jgi:hypothetical protein
MKNQRETIRKIIGNLNNEDADGGFWLPNIQRPFVWKEDQIERLFDSIMRQYPISTLLVWRTTSSIKHRRFIDNFKPTLKLTDFYVPDNDKAKRLVLDGQQRLQSLFIGLKGSYQGRELHFDVLSGDLVAPEDIRYRFSFLPAKKVAWPWVNFKDIVISHETPTKLAKLLAKEAPVPLDETALEKVTENVERAKQEFTQDENIAYQELDSIDDPDAYDENDVVEVFIRANSGGTKLGKSDLLFSLLSSSWDEADVRMEELLEDLNANGYCFDRDFVLKTCLTLLDRGAQYRVNKFRDGKTKEEIVSGWEGIKNAIKDVADFVYEKTYIRHDKALTSYLALIPLIYFRYHYPKAWPKAKQMDDYVLRSLLAGAFSGAPDKLIDKCVKAINDDSGFDAEHIFEVIHADGRNLEVSPEMLLGFGYGMKETHLCFNLWYKQFHYHPAYSNNVPQVDHIFPQSLLKSKKETSTATGRAKRVYSKQTIDQIANCMLLKTKENGPGGKSDTAPDEWFAQRVKDEGEAYLDQHLIPRDKKLWKLENFEKFIEARKKLLVENFDFILRKGGRK